MWLSTLSTSPGRTELIVRVLVSMCVQGGGRVNSGTLIAGVDDQ